MGEKREKPKTALSKVFDERGKKKSSTQVWGINPKTKDPTRQ
jgi:hypothetical protein